jgi:hypothetical protein
VVSKYPTFRLAIEVATFKLPFAVGWQRAQAAPLQYHGNKSAFSKLEADTNKLSRKRDSPTNRDSSLQERLVEALESTRPQKVLLSSTPLIMLSSVLN